MYFFNILHLFIISIKETNKPKSEQYTEIIKSIEEKKDKEIIKNSLEEYNTQINYNIYLKGINKDNFIDFNSDILDLQIKLCELLNINNKTKILEYEKDPKINVVYSTDNKDISIFIYSESKYLLLGNEKIVNKEIIELIVDRKEIDINKKEKINNYEIKIYKNNENKIEFSLCKNNKFYFVTSDYFKITPLDSEKKEESFFMLLFALSIISIAIFFTFQAYNTYKNKNL